MKIYKNCGIVFWITGLSGSGKSTISEKLKTFLEKKFGETLIIHGDNIRNIYNYKSYSKYEMLKLGKANSNFCNLIANQKINVIFTTAGLLNALFKHNKKSL